MGGANSISQNRQKTQSLQGNDSRRRLFNNASTQIQTKRSQNAKKPKPVISYAGERKTETKVNWRGEGQVGNIIIDTQNRHLYLIEKSKRKDMPGIAYRYTIKPPEKKLDWYGSTKVVAKKIDPTWTPPQGMLKRNKKLKNKPVPGGTAANPLGRYVIYLNRTAIRIHRAQKQGSVAAGGSNGCIGMYGGDIKTFYDKVKIGAKVEKPKAKKI